MLTIELSELNPKVNKMRGMASRENASGPISALMALFSQRHQYHHSDGARNCKQLCRPNSHRAAADVPLLLPIITSLRASAAVKPSTGSSAVTPTYVQSATASVESIHPKSITESQKRHGFKNLQYLLLDMGTRALLQGHQSARQQQACKTHYSRLGPGQAPRCPPLGGKTPHH